MTHFLEKKLIGISTGADFSAVGGEPEGVGKGVGAGRPQSDSALEMTSRSRGMFGSGQGTGGHISKSI